MQRGLNGARCRLEGAHALVELTELVELLRIVRRRRRRRAAHHCARDSAHHGAITRRRGAFPGSWPASAGEDATWHATSGRGARRFSCRELRLQLVRVANALVALEGRKCLAAVDEGNGAVPGFADSRSARAVHAAELEPRLEHCRDRLELVRHKLSLFPRQLAARREAPCLALRALRDRALHHEELLERAPLDSVGLGPREDGALVLLKWTHAVGRVPLEESARRLRHVLERLLTHKAQPRLALWRPGGGRPCPRPVRLLPGGGVLLRRLSKALRFLARLRHALPRRTEARPRHHKVDGQHEQDKGRGDRVLEQEDGHRQRLVHINMLARCVDDLRVACVEHGDQ